MPSPGTDGGTSTPAPPSVPGFSSEITPTIPTPSDPVTAPPGRVGTPAPSQRIRFVPEQVVLPGGASAPVLPATTVNGQLQVRRRLSGSAGGTVGPRLVIRSARWSSPVT